MAAIDLKASRTAPLVYGVTLSTNWQEFQLPEWVRRVTVKGSAAIYVAFTQSEGATQPVDGAAASGTTHKCSLAADAMVSFLTRDPGDRPKHVDVTIARSIFVAAQSGTPTLELILEMAGS